jgi:hypothetical protein
VTKHGLGYDVKEVLKVGSEVDVAIWGSELMRRS